MEVLGAGVTVRELQVDEFGLAAAVLSRGMRDNPLHQRVFGADSERREFTLRRFFQVLLRQYGSRCSVLGAFAAATLVGVCTVVSPGQCQPGPRAKLALFRTLVPNNSLMTVFASLKWNWAWTRYDPSAPHWHLGPVGVERELQGRGIGTALLGAARAWMDRAPAVAYLETDKRVNVAFYERFGFEVTDRAVVLGVPNWFMVRVSPL